MNKYSVTAMFEFNDDAMIDIISSAIYDIKYWGAVDDDTDEWNAMSESLPKDHTWEDVFYNLIASGKSIYMYDTEGDDGPWHLTIDKLLNGIKLAIENGYWDGQIDSLDGEVGDIIFQYTLFEEIVYG